MVQLLWHEKSRERDLSCKEKIWWPECNKCKKTGHLQGACKWDGKPDGKKVENPPKGKFAWVIGNDKSKGWIIDCASYAFNCNDLNSFVNLIRLDAPEEYTLANGDVSSVSHYGRVRVKLSYSGEITEIDNVRFVADAPHNLLGLGRLETNGYRVSFNIGICSLVRNGKFQTLHQL